MPGLSRSNACSSYICSNYCVCATLISSLTSKNKPPPSKFLLNGTNQSKTFLPNDNSIFLYQPKSYGDLFLNDESFFFWEPLFSMNSIVVY